MHSRSSGVGNGKCNKDGRLEYGSFLGNKEVEVCPLGGLAFPMFDRFDIGREAYPESETTYPSFEKPKDWYDLKVLAKEHKPLDEINYSTHRNAMNKAYEAPGMSFKASTHAMRGSAARMADLQGASKESIRRAGRWNTEAMESCYLTTLPIETIRAHAGFNPKGADFFLPGVQAPEALKKKVFPFASEELARVRI
jgi:hypothetical protein